MLAAIVQRKKMRVRMVFVLVWLGLRDKDTQNSEKTYPFWRSYFELMEQSGSMLTSVIDSATIRFIVAWKPKDAPKDEAEHAVLLIDINLKRR